MDEQESKRAGMGRYLWPLLVVALLWVLWWYFRPGENHKDVAVQDDAAAQAIDRDDVLVDLKDDASAAQVAAIERDLGIQLVAVDDSGEAADTKLYRAHVDPAREDAIVETLSQRPEVEIAEPDSVAQLSPDEMTEVEVPVDTTHEGFPNDPLFGKQWNMKQIGMPEAWQLGQGNGVISSRLPTAVPYRACKTFHA